MTFKEDLIPLLIEYGWEINTQLDAEVLADDVETLLQSKIVEPAPDPDPVPEVESPKDVPPKPDN